MAPSHILAYFGTNTHGRSRGIYRAWFNPDNGEFSEVALAVEAANPTFLATCLNRGLLFATSELPETAGRREGSLYAYSVNAESGQLKLINRVHSGGMNPCYVAADPSLGTVITANIRGGSVASFRIEDNGSLRGPVSLISHNVSGAGVHPRLQDASHPHSIRFDPKGRFAIACDRGADRVFLYRHDHATSRIVPHDPYASASKRGAGPRHLVFHPSERSVYVLNELNSTIVVMNYNADRGVLEQTQIISTIPSDFRDENMTAEIEITSCGRFLYCSNRGHNSIAVFAVAPDTGRLNPLGHCGTRGDWPRTIRVDPSGKWLIAANARTCDAFAFRIDQADGSLEAVAEGCEIANPTCVVFF